MTVKENYQNLGLSFSVRPRMIQSKEGSKLVDEATVQMNPDFFSSHARNKSGIVEEEKEEEPKDLGKLFPEIKPAAESIIEKTHKHLKHDEVEIC